MIRFEQTFDAAALDYDSNRPLYPPRCTLICCAMCR